MEKASLLFELQLFCFSSKLIRVEMGVVTRGGCGFRMWSPSNPPFQNPVYRPAIYIKGKSNVLFSAFPVFYTHRDSIPHRMH